MDQAEKAQIKSELTTDTFLATGQAFLRLGLVTVILTGGILLIWRNYFINLFYVLMAFLIYDPLSGVLANIVRNFQRSIENCSDLRNRVPIQEDAQVFRRWFRHCI